MSSLEFTVSSKKHEMHDEDYNAHLRGSLSAVCLHTVL